MFWRSLRLALPAARGTVCARGRANSWRLSGKSKQARGERALCVCVCLGGGRLYWFVGRIWAGELCAVDAL